MKKLLFFILILFWAADLSAQYSDRTIKVLNIDEGTSSNRRANQSDRGYTLKNSRMVNALAKLGTANFGTGAKVSNPITVDSKYGDINSITSSVVSDLNTYDIIFVGYFYRNSQTSQGIKDDEITILKNWAEQAGKILIVMEQSANYPLSKSLGYPIVNGTSGSSTPTQYDTSYKVDLFDGIFGTATNIVQGGGALGHFSASCSGIPIAKDTSGNTAILFDTGYNSLLFGDTDYFTNVTNRVTSGSSISSDADKVWANTWAWAIREVLANKSHPGTDTNNAGTISLIDSDQSMCNDTATIGVRDNTFVVSAWQTSTDGGTTWTTIDGETDINLTITTSDVVDGQLYRVKTKGALATCTEYTSSTYIVDKSLCSNICKKPSTNSSAAAKSSVGIATKKVDLENWPTIVPNGYLVLDSATKGMVVTSMTTTEINNLTPLEGMVVYDNTVGCVKLYRGISPTNDSTRTGWNCIKQGCNE